MYTIFWMKPFLVCFKKCGCMKNADSFDRYHNKIIFELDFFKMYENIYSVRDEQKLL